MQSSFPATHLAIAALASICTLCAYAQPPADPQVRNYSYGVGRIAWTFPAGLPAGFSVPRWSAGARVTCEEKELRCEVQVLARDISVADTELREELELALRLRLQKPGRLGERIQVYDTAARVVYLSAEDTRGGYHLRYLTLGYAYVGPALLRFEVTANRAEDARPVLALVEGAKSLDAIDMWSLRLREFRSVCEDRLPEFRAANDRAFAASPFAAVDPVRETARPEPETPIAFARRRLLAFTTTFDAHPPQRRRQFCEGFPRWVAEAARGL